MTEDTVSAIVVEDDAIVRSWLRDLLQGTEFRLIGEASSIGEALPLIRRRLPDALAVDYRLPDGLGTDLVRQLEIPSLIMSAGPEPGLNETARAAGAYASVLKTGSGDEILRALRTIVSGGRLFDERHPRWPKGRAPLSPRERDVVRLVAAGRTNREIAADLQIGPETVKTLVSRAFAKLGVGRRAEAAAAAQRLHLL